MSAEPSPSANSAIRQLLFAAAALRHSFIDEQRFVQAVVAWAAEPQRSLAEILIERKWLGASDLVLVEQLVQRRLAQRDANKATGTTETLDAELERALQVLNDPALRSALPPGGEGISVVLSTEHSRDRYREVKDAPEKGGIGQVWRVFDKHLEREVALKELQPQKALDSTARRRFVREAKITAQLMHPNIVPVFELIQPEADVLSFYTMKFVEGRTLAEEVEAYHSQRSAGQTNPLQFHKLIDAFVDVCHAVAHAHSKGVLHRDLKSSNVILGGNGEVFLVDWGLAKELGDDHAEHVESTIHWEKHDADDVTIRGAVMGTPAYMPPEQACGLVEMLDERSDVFGLGAILCHVLTGQPPYQGKTTDELIDQAREGNLDEAFGRLDACGHDTPFVDLAKKCLAKNMNDRPRSADEVARAVEGHRAAAQERLRRAELERKTAEAKAQEERRRRRAERVLATVGIVITVLLCIVGVRSYLDRADFNRNLDAIVQKAKTQLGHAKRTLVNLKEQLGNASAYRLLGDLNGWQNKLQEVQDTVDREEKAIPDIYRAALPEEGTEQFQSVKSLLQEQMELLQLATTLDDLRLADFSLCEARPVPGVAGPRLAELIQTHFHLARPIQDLSAKEQGEFVAGVKADTLLFGWAAALDHWAAFTANPILRERLVAVLGQIDPDPWRDLVRDLKSWKDRHHLKRLATGIKEDPHLEQQSSHILIGLAHRLALAGNRDDGLALLKQVHQTSLPGDVGVVLFWGKLTEGKERYPILNNAVFLRAKSAVVQNSLGYALLDQGDEKQALKHFASALQYDAAYPDAYWNLGIAHLRLGQFKDAQDALGKGAELGRKQPGWDEVLTITRKDECQRLLALDQKLPDLQDDFTSVKKIPLVERLELARLCAKYKKNYGLAVDLYESVCPAAPVAAPVADGLPDGVHFEAACAAVQAALQADGGTKAKKLRSRALAWLAFELGVIKQQMQKEPLWAVGPSTIGLMASPLGQGPLVAGATIFPGREQKEEKSALKQRLAQWRQDHRLATVRPPSPEFAQLAEEEQTTWRRFWLEVDYLALGTESHDSTADLPRKG